MPLTAICVVTSLALASPANRAPEINIPLKNRIVLSSFVSFHCPIARLFNRLAKLLWRGDVRVVIHFSRFLLERNAHRLHTSHALQLSFDSRGAGGAIHSVN